MGHLDTCGTKPAQFLVLFQTLYSYLKAKRSEIYRGMIQGRSQPSLFGSKAIIFSQHLVSGELGEAATGLGAQRKPSWAWYASDQNPTKMPYQARMNVLNMT